MEGGKESADTGDSDAQDNSDVEREVEYPWLQAVLKTLTQVGAMVRSVFVGADSCEESGDVAASAAAPYSVQYESLAFLREVVNRLCIQDVLQDFFVVELSEQVMILVDRVFTSMDYASQPTFVSCAVLRLLGDFQKLMETWKEHKHNEKHTVTTMYKKWVDRYEEWLVHSSCSTVALQLLNDKESSGAASQMAFIGNSSRYPFLQQWLLCLSHVGVALMEAATTAKTSTDGVGFRPLNLTDRPPIPTRQQLFAVLAEQDDVLIEVLNGLTRMKIFVDAVGSSSDHSVLWPSALATRMVVEYNPDLLFADLVDVLRRDHLVLLDLLVSNGTSSIPVHNLFFTCFHLDKLLFYSVETQMLEYIMRYLRYLSTHWDSSKQILQTDERLEGVMSVLIRLRLEIDRLVAADLFPYGSGPLTRRLRTVEQLYEGPESDTEQL
ncbi:unnamed protein product [Phytophthora lilii]|uniref:Unnamed protein product n=1 Tax=Phytophthora lilii TaxID=2077276 RepID=A0A9W6TKY2_9STRA|nr:unnamed protein product [Phytophthora lilii]